MHQPSQMLIRLNMATRAHHADVDAPWLDLLVNRATATSYIQALIKAYGFEAPVEAALAYTPGIAALRYVHHPRAGLIAGDLMTVGLDPMQLTRLPTCHEVTPFHDLPEALGWLYVVERSTLLHPNVYARLALMIPEAERAFSYLQHGGNVGARWSAFGAALDHYATSEAAANEIVHAATYAFECQRRWLRGRSDKLARAAG